MSKSRWRYRFAAIGLGLLVAAGLAEVAVRVISTTDADGNTRFLGRRLRPFRPPIELVRTQASEYAEHLGCIAYDEQIGWSPRPGCRSVDGLYHFDASGIRIAEGMPDYSTVPESGLLRIALFGDSFTHGEGLAFEETWGYQLQQLLNRAGIRVEVLNLGFSGYGMDQALLRWRAGGRDLQPDVVLFGFQPENTIRNLNLVRPLVVPEVDLPFTKPRFVMTDAGLRLINSPSVKPDDVPQLLAKFEAWEFHRHETMWDTLDVDVPWWFHSRLIALLDRLASPPVRHYLDDAKFFDASREPTQLAHRIVKTFATEVAATGAEFVVVEIPLRRWLLETKSRQPLTYADLRQAIVEDLPMIETSQALLESSRTENLSDLTIREGDGHYSARASTALAQAVASGLIEHLDLQPEREDATAK